MQLGSRSPALPYRGEPPHLYQHRAAPPEGANTYVCSPRARYTSMCFIHSLTPHNDPATQLVCSSLYGETEEQRG